MLPAASKSTWMRVPVVGSLNILTAWPAAVVELPTWSKLVTRPSTVVLTSEPSVPSTFCRI